MFFEKAKKITFKPRCPHCNEELGEIGLAAYAAQKGAEGKLVLRAAPATGEECLVAVTAYLCPACKKILALDGPTAVQNIGTVEIVS